MLSTSPAAIPVTTVPLGSGTGTGTWLSPLAPSPSWPSKLSPQASTRPAEVSASVCLPPAATAVILTPAGSFTLTGNATFLPIVPLPSWPLRSSPQARKYPARAERLAAAIADGAGSAASAARAVSAVSAATHITGLSSAVLAAIESSSCRSRLLGWTLLGLTGCDTRPMESSRRGFLKTSLAGAGASAIGAGAALAGTGNASASAIDSGAVKPVVPFYGEHQAGIV